MEIELYGKYENQSFEVQKQTRKELFIDERDSLLTLKLYFELVKSDEYAEVYSRDRKLSTNRIVCVWFVEFTMPSVDGNDCTPRLSLYVEFTEDLLKLIVAYDVEILNLLLDLYKGGFDASTAIEMFTEELAKGTPIEQLRLIRTPKQAKRSLLVGKL